MTSTLPILDRNGVIAYVGQNAARYGLDPAAVLSVANHEGLNNGPGSNKGLKWWLPGESNWSFGPPSWYGGVGAAGAAILQMFSGNSDQAAQWSWTSAGIDYWLQQVSQSARGLTGRDAVTAIVNGFERPREDLRAGEVTNAMNDYNMFSGLVAGTTGNAPVTTNPPAASGGFDPGTGTGFGGSIGATNVGASGTAVGGSTQLGQVGPFPVNVPSGMALGAIAVLLLILGVLLFAFNLEFHQQTVAVSASGVSS